MLYLIATLLCVAAGPLFASLARRARATTIALDAFVLVVLGGLVLLHILPHAVEGAGLLALVAAAGAFTLASLPSAACTVTTTTAGPTATGMPASRRA